MPRRKQKKGGAPAVGLDAVEVGSGAPPAEVEALAAHIAADGGTALCAYRDPYGGKWLIMLALGLLACGGSPGLRLGLIDASVRRPSNVAVYFTVDTSDGEPVAGLVAKDFQIYEDGAPVSELESKQTILNPEVAAAHYTLLLIDMSGSVTESGDVPVILEAARSFAARVEKYQKVAVHAFDGGASIVELAGFSTGPGLAAGVERLGSFRARDPSTNLNGAVVKALEVLRRQLAASPVPLTFGTLVVFTDGTDRAGRVTREQLHAALDQVDFDVLVVGVGAEIDGGELGSIGRDGAILSKDRGAIVASFDAAAARIEAFSKRYYLLGYCSPARAGRHEVTIATTVRGRSGSLRYQFDARGFGPHCDPTQKPAFNTNRPRPGKAPVDSGGEGEGGGGKF